MMILSALVLLGAQESPATPPKHEPVVAVILSSRAQPLSPDGTELAFRVDDGSVGFCTLSSFVADRGWAWEQRNGRLKVFDVAIGKMLAKAELAGGDEK
jgi:hypothetical protein